MPDRYMLVTERTEIVNIGQQLANRAWLLVSYDASLARPPCDLAARSNQPHAAYCSPQRQRRATAAVSVSRTGKPLPAALASRAAAASNPPCRSPEERTSTPRQRTRPKAGASAPAPRSGTTAANTQKIWS